MTLTVLLFASYADAFGAPHVRVELPDESTVDDLLARVRALRPEHPLPPALVAVNQEYAARGQRIGAADEVAIIPPVAGG
jgi:molybdopterin converting factor subunit 1